MSERSWNPGCLMPIAMDMDFIVISVDKCCSCAFGEESCEG
jgi:hypothetical protein